MDLTYVSVAYLVNIKKQLQINNYHYLDPIHMVSGTRDNPSSRANFIQRL